MNSIDERFERFKAKTNPAKTLSQKAISAQARARRHATEKDFKLKRAQKEAKIERARRRQELWYKRYIKKHGHSFVAPPPITR